MELISFRIRNYRSIKDSGLCYLSDDNVTILAGKNESGKTAILEALEDFNVNKPIRKEAIPLYREKADPEITATFEIGKAELQKLAEETKIKLIADKPITIEIKKKFPNEYIVSDDIINLIGISKKQLLRENLDEFEPIYAELKNSCTNYPQISSALPDLNAKDFKALIPQLKSFRQNIQPHLNQIPDATIKNNILVNYQKLLDLVVRLPNHDSMKSDLVQRLKILIPNFILFSSFNDIFPSEIPLTEARNNGLIKDLQLISDLDLQLIMSGPNNERARHKRLVNVNLIANYKKFWTQDLTNLNVDWDSGKLQFFITEGEDFYPPNMRSKGKQWHLAFYVRISARAKEHLPNVILIDEPGLFLHAKAQEDILDKIEDAAKDTPIILSTHSPYLIKVNRLNRIRLISKDTEKDGTVISNKIHKGADKETLTPIITAIGLDLSKGLDIAKDNNIIVEGITDYYYLTALKEHLGFAFKEEVHFIPSMGAAKSDLLAQLMIGWGFNYCILLDNDAEGIRVNTKLIKELGHTDIKTLMISENKDERVEDVFSRDDFIKYVLNQETDQLPTDKSNSQIVKDKDAKYDNVLLAKQFFEKSTRVNVKLAKNTTDNFNKLFQKIDSLLFPPK